MHIKSNVSRKTKTAYNLERREWFVVWFIIPDGLSKYQVVNKLNLVLLFSQRNEMKV